MLNTPALVTWRSQHRKCALSTPALGVALVRDRNTRNGSTKHYSTPDEVVWNTRFLHKYQNVGQWVAMTLVSGNIRHMRILTGVPLGGDFKWEWGCWQRLFVAIWVATSSETSEIRPAILYDDILPLVGLWLIAFEWPRMTLSGYFT